MKKKYISGEEKSVDLGNVGDEINKYNHNFTAMDVDSEDDDVYHILKLEDSSWKDEEFDELRNEKLEKDFILRSAQQEEALHRIWYALKRWRLVSQWIVLFPTTTCSSINRR
ncbi:unnamed protein product [Spirodela intermedia]|uniref:Uncharacterized protein n=1 Tax=Spirodela intermedia TaxID=51605 RepID=A0A7I8IKX8_SPIIN|nr:unnamed protein product [Spirodela intermedia]CAA6658542.1 unnamed protein product [Spirodela intermedia]